MLEEVKKVKEDEKKKELGEIVEKVSKKSRKKKARKKSKDLELIPKQLDDEIEKDRKYLDDVDAYKVKALYSDLDFSAMEIANIRFKAENKRLLIEQQKIKITHLVNEITLLNNTIGNKVEKLEKKRIDRDKLREELQKKYKLDSDTWGFNLESHEIVDGDKV